MKRDDDGGRLGVSVGAMRGIIAGGDDGVRAQGFEGRLADTPGSWPEEHGSRHKEQKVENMGGEKEGVDEEAIRSRYAAA